MAEVDELTASLGDGDLSWEDAGKLKYLDMVFTEAGRHVLAVWKSKYILDRSKNINYFSGL